MKKSILITGLHNPEMFKPSSVQEMEAEARQGTHAMEAPGGPEAKTACGIYLKQWKTHETGMAVDCAGCRAIIKHFKEYKTT